MKRLATEFDIGTLALAVSVAWLLFVQLLAVLAWETELLTRQGALLHWLVLGVLPPALALWGMPVPRR
ncbi:hypothetical protein [Falsiroseomonas sp. HW251]|uniref:hypothetical protein n=1 Tax=Falsiroseomonas sp. HW251 TaxID=3390998 RepID=UPI003D30F859